MRKASGIKKLKGDSRSDTEDSTDSEALQGMEVSMEIYGQSENIHGTAS